jgi:protein-tyrosine phosphatase
MWNKLFTRAAREAIDYSWITADMHAHLIPGIDDGAKDLDEALALVAGMRRIGFRRLTATPHVMSDYYPNTRAGILAGAEKLNKAVRSAGIDVRLGTAAEYYLDEHFIQLLERDELLCLPDRRLLVEISFFAEPPWLNDYLFRIQAKGYRPVLAHPERYGFFHHRMESYRALHERGCEFQLNMLSLSGHYGAAVRRCAEQLLRAGLVDFLGTDLHHQGHLNELAQSATFQAIRRASGRRMWNGEL